MIRDASPTTTSSISQHLHDFTAKLEITLEPWQDVKTTFSTHGRIPKLIKNVTESLASAFQDGSSKFNKKLISHSLYKDNTLKDK